MTWFRDAHGRRSSLRTFGKRTRRTFGRSVASLYAGRRPFCIFDSATTLDILNRCSPKTDLRKLEPSPFIQTHKCFGGCSGDFDLKFWPTNSSFNSFSLLLLSRFLNYEKLETRPPFYLYIPRLFRVFENVFSILD